ncbi:MAG TPA: DUF4058 family protein [Thermoguttaceae bacterium]|nr:DUF4058 family protein [Thermoguttaceae bacterium]
MTLNDHFGPPLSLRRHWHAFHNAWSTYLASHLNQQLPEGYFAEANVQYGIEIDVATFEERGPAGHAAVSTWTAPAPTRTMLVPMINDVVEVLVFDREGGPILVGAIELVSPANKDRPEHRDAFVSKCAAYLQQGIGLVIVDVVTSRRGNLHEDLLARLGSSGGTCLDSDLYAVAYRLVERAERPSLDIWEERLAVGQSLPTMPLWLGGGLCLAVDFEATYRRTCQEQRILADAS